MCVCVCVLVIRTVECWRRSIVKGLDCWMLETVYYKGVVCIVSMITNIDNNDSKRLYYILQSAWWCPYYLQYLYILYTCTYTSPNSSTIRGLLQPCWSWSIYAQTSETVKEDLGSKVEKKSAKRLVCLVKTNRWINSLHTIDSYKNLECEGNTTTHWVQLSLKAPESFVKK